jgi:Cu-Zn family superoxide dismutase
MTVKRNSRFALLPVVILGLVAVGCGQQQTEEVTTDQAATPSTPAASGRNAEARIEPLRDAQVTGVAHFAAVGPEVSFHIRIENAPPGTHAIHLHEFGDCSGPDGTAAGEHWNPTGVEHGQWGVDPFHLGDIGNLVVDNNGVGEMMMTTDLWTIGGPDATNVVGRSIIVHTGADDFTSQPTGGAGGRIGCGVIEAAPR